MQRCLCQNFPKPKKGSLIWQQYLLPIRIAMLLLEQAIDVDVISFNSASRWLFWGYTTHGSYALVFWLEKHRFQTTKHIAQNMGMDVYFFVESFCCWIPSLDLFARPSVPVRKPVFGNKPCCHLGVGWCVLWTVRMRVVVCIVDLKYIHILYKYDDVCLVFLHIHISIYLVHIHLQLPQWWLPAIGLSLDGWWNSIHFDWVLPILLVQTDILHFLELLLTPLRRWRVYIESLQQMQCEPCSSAKCSLKIWVFFRFKEHASVKKGNNLSKCHYHVVKHSELSKGTMTEVSTRQTNPVTSV